MTSIVRPVVTFGPERIPLAVVSRKHQWTLVERIRSGKPVVFTDKREALHYVMPSELFGQAVVALFGRDEADGEIFNVAMAKGYHWDEIAAMIGRAVGREPLIVHVPVEWFAAYSRDFYIELKYNKDENLTFDTAKIAKMAPKVDLEQSVEPYVAATVQALADTQAGRPLDADFNAMCDQLLLRYAAEGTDDKEREIAQAYRQSLGDAGVQAVTRQAVAYQRRERRGRLVNGTKAAIKHILPDLAVQLIRRCRH